MLNSNIKAFLDMLAFSEGTSRLGNQNGYNVIVGNTFFTDYSNHPHKLVKVNENLSSTAAGRYQVLARYFDAYKKQLNLPDFSPASQDAIAIQQIKECNAFADIIAGRFFVAVKKCAHIWASLPTAGYGQRENNIDVLKQAYILHGGTLILTT